MAIYDQPRTEGDKPFVYLLGSRMVFDRLQQIANELDAQVGIEVTIHLLDTDGPGSEIAENLDIGREQLPAILICAADESIYQDWYGEDLPSTEQIIYAIQRLTGSAS